MSAKSYRELANMILAQKHMDIEYGLRKMDEQESFIAAVAEKLTRTSWVHHMRMDRHFDVTFVLQAGWIALPHQKQAIEQHLSAAFDVEQDGQALVVADPKKDWLQCRVVFGGDE
ncbi:hypothetical protein [Snodgrassella sp. CFCC 13594]|uniref:hypothetical protein n=1 Tax=Snodgrassella sp. CFCC 13594 TaxID=1775559 RepID=UPI00083188D8|nr:hypothetical protein [Snodgrassella sp. CFCC 13594]